MTRELEGDVADMCNLSEAIVEEVSREKDLIIKAKDEENAALRARIAELEAKAAQSQK